MPDATASWRPWSPQPGPQQHAIEAACIPELFFGGARGGGKSDYLLGDYLADVKEYGEEWRGILFRRTYSELEELIARSKAIFPASFPGAELVESRATWTLPGGATLRMRYLERDADAARYQGHQYTWIGFDELTNWPSDVPYRQLLATLRNGNRPIPVKRVRSSGNPGGPGHQWVKSRFVTPAPGGYRPTWDEQMQWHRVFIPSRVRDNAILLANDPQYVNRLRGVGSAALVRAWLEGDWDVIQGAYFDRWSSERHVVRPFAIPQHWTRIRSFDWGFARPFSVGWWAVASEDHARIPKGCMVRYREWYGAAGPNTGVRLPAEAIAAGIKEREGRDVVNDAVADPAIWDSSNGPSIAERMTSAGVYWRPADNKRIAGWDQVRARLEGESDERPMVVCFDTCVDSIRTIPALQHDDKKPEDLDTDGEDHAADEWRYGLMARPWVRPLPEAAKPMTTIRDVTLGRLWQDVEREDGRV